MLRSAQRRARAMDLSPSSQYRPGGPDGGYQPFALVVLEEPTA
jgi:hypothetical protein